MAITVGEVEVRYSGGSANANPSASLGGVKSTQQFTGPVNGLFDDVEAGEAAAGDDEYRCMYYHNASATDTATDVLLWILNQDDEGSKVVSVGVGTSAVNGTEQTIADEDTPPTGVTFSEPSTKAAAVSLGSVPPGQSKAFWVRRSIAAGAAGSANDEAALRIEVEFAA